VPGAQDQAGPSSPQSTPTITAPQDPCPAPPDTVCAAPCYRSGRAQPDRHRERNTAALFRQYPASPDPTCAAPVLQSASCYFGLV